MLIAAFATALGVGAAVWYNELTIAGTSNGLLFMLLAFSAPTVFLVVSVRRRAWREVALALALAAIAGAFLGPYIASGCCASFD